MNISIDMTQVFLGVISMITIIITSVVVPWIKSKTTATQQDTIRCMLHSSYLVMAIMIKRKNMLYSKSARD